MRRWFCREWRSCSPEARKLLGEFERKIRYRFHNPKLLIQALKHRSYLTVSEESRGGANERLEFLGDSVLDLVSSEYLFQAYPDKLEGDLTQMKSVLVSGSVLAREAERFGLGKYLLLSANEAKSGGRNRYSILEDAFEALIGALYLDGGFQQARRLVLRELLEHSDYIFQDTRHQNYKSLLLEHAQAHGIAPPEYFVKEEIGPEHQKKFVVEVIMKDPIQPDQQIRGMGEGNTKKDAEQMAAREAARELHLIT
jgi:ribonuclease-3